MQPVFCHSSNSKQAAGFVAGQVAKLVVTYLSLQYFEASQPDLQPLQVSAGFKAGQPASKRVNLIHNLRETSLNNAYSNLSIMRTQ